MCSRMSTRAIWLPSPRRAVTSTALSAGTMPCAGPYIYTISCVYPIVVISFFFSSQDPPGPPLGDFLPA